MTHAGRDAMTTVHRKRESARIPACAGASYWPSAAPLGLTCHPCEEGIPLDGKFHRFSTGQVPCLRFLL